MQHHEARPGGVFRPPLPTVYHASHGLQRPFTTATAAAEYDAAYQAWPARCAILGAAGSPAWIGWHDAAEIAAGAVGLDDMASFSGGLQ